MCSISDIPFVGAVVNHISEAAVGAVSRGIRYILFYKDNVNKLKSEIEGLKTKEQRIERRVERAKNNGQTIEEHVVKWQDDVKVFKEEVAEVLGKCDDRTSWRCFNVLRCPNPYRRFQIGRWAAKKTTTVSDLEKKQPTGEISYFSPPDYSPISSTEYQKFGSRDVAYEKILKALNCKEDGFPVVGVYGFGGVGKTWMMEKASKEVEEKGIFKTVARANVGQKVDIGKIQYQLAPYLDITVKSEDRTSQLKARLSKGDTILVILDDVWSEISFAEIGIPFGDPSIKGCKILLTSRSRRVCILNKCEDPVEIEALTADEAWGMFTKTVGDSTIKSVDESLARQVCNKCARLPLIISVVGKALRERDQPFWKDALSQLMNYKPEKIDGIPPDAYDCLRLSFKILQKDAYVCLLLCSLAGEDEEIEIEFLFRLATGTGLLEDYGNTLEDARNRVDAMVSVLKSSSLLLEGRDCSSVKLHDIIRDVARSIIHDNESEYKFLSESNFNSLSHKKDILSSRKLIYLDFESDNVCFPGDLMCPDLHTLYLKCSNRSGVQPPDSFFKSFPKLKYLLLDIKSLYTMPSSIQNLDSLRSLTIHRCKVNDPSHIIQLKNLEMLSVQGSCFGDRPLDLRQLGRLRMLDLRACTEIMGIVLAPGLMCLEELYLPQYCNILDEEKRKIPLSSVPSKLMTSLKIYFEDVKSCPDENFCKKLCRYDICVGVGVIQAREFENILKRDSTILKSVYFCDDCIGGGVKTLVERGEYVALERVTGLQKCFSRGGAFTDLKRLDIRACMGVEYLFCTSTARCLQQLEELVISGCMMMKEIIRNEGQINEIIDFPKLRDLRLLKLPVLKSLCKEAVFPALKSLFIRALDNITEIWEEHGHLKEESFCQLTHLKVSGCHKLKNVIPYAMRQRLQNLEELKIVDCEMMEEIVRNECQINEIIDFPKLSYLGLKSLPVLKSLFCEKVSFPSLETLIIIGVKINLEQIHIGSDYTSKLIKVVVSSESQAPQLIPPNWLLASRDLESLAVSNCHFHEWDLFRLLGNSSGKNNPYGTISFRRLQEVDVNLCTLSTIFTCSVAKGLQELEILKVRSCGSIEEIVTDERRNDQLVMDACEEISFPKLRTVVLDDLPNLKSFCPSANCCFKMLSLEDVEITRCPQMLSFTPRQISTPKVRLTTTHPSLDGEGYCESEGTTTDINSYLHQIMNTQALMSTTAISANMNNVPMLNGTNFKDWKENILIVIGCMDIDLALRMPKPNDLTEESTPEEIGYFEKWDRSNRLSLMIMKRGIPEAFRGAITNDNITAIEFLSEIQNRFVKNDKAETSTLLASLISMKYKGKGNVREYIMEMSHLASKLKALKLDLSDDMLVHLILISLPAQFSQFKVSYNCQKEKWTLNELISFCVQEEERLKQDRTESAHFASTSKGKGKKRDRGKEVDVSKGPGQKKQKTENGCFFCGKPGHKKKDCTKFAAWREKKGLPALPNAN